MEVHVVSAQLSPDVDSELNCLRHEAVQKSSDGTGSSVTLWGSLTRLTIKSKELPQRTRAHTHTHTHTHTHKPTNAQLNIKKEIINPFTAEVAIMQHLGSAPKSDLCDQKRRSKVTGLSDLMTSFIDLGCLYCKQTQRAFNVFKNTLN
jgi:hypothetical protein